MPWKECSAMDERVKLIARFLEGEKVAALAGEFGISRKTAYKVIDRYRDTGLEGLSDRSRRPYRHANQLLADIAPAIEHIMKINHNIDVEMKPLTPARRYLRAYYARTLN